MSLFFFPSGSPPPLFTLPYKNGRPAPGRWRRPGQRRYGRPEAAVHEAAAGQRVRGFLFFSFLPSARIRRRLIAFPPWRARGGTPGRRSIGLPTPGRALARTELTAGLHCDPSASPPPRARASRKFRVTAFSPTRPPDLLFLPPSPTSRSADGTPGSTTPARTPHQATSLADLLANTTVSELMRPQVRRGEGEERGEGRGRGGRACCPLGQPAAPLSLSPPHPSPPHPLTHTHTHKNAPPPSILPRPFCSRSSSPCPPRRPWRPP